MADIATAAWLFVRRWRLLPAATAAVLCGALWMVLPRSLYDVPARDGVQGALWPLVPGLFTAFLPLALSTAADVQERMVAQPSRLRTLTVAVITIPSAFVLTCGASISPEIAVRNTVLLVGLALWSSCLLPRGAAWAPPVLTPMLMWLLGTKPFGTAAPWALLLLPGEVAYASGIAASIGLSGALMYVFRGCLWADA